MSCVVLQKRAKFGGKKMEKIRNGVRTAYGAILLRVLQPGFGYSAVFNTLKEGYPWPSIVLRRHRFASFRTFVEARQYIKIGVTIFIAVIPHERDV